MSRWDENFKKHQIHSTLDQLFEWTKAGKSELSSDTEIERRRFVKVLTNIRALIEDIDPEFYAESSLTTLDQNLRHSNIWQQLKSYSQTSNVDHLVTANNYISNFVHLLNQINLKPSESSRIQIVENIENQYDAFCKSIEDQLNDFAARLLEGESEISVLGAQLNSLNAEYSELSISTGSALNEWQTKFTEGQVQRSEEYSSAEIKRKETFADLLQEIKSEATAEQQSIADEFVVDFKTSIKDFNDFVETTKGDIETKHNAILTLHGIVTTNGVAGGYKKSAGEERGAANGWRITAMFCFGLAAVWMFVKVLAYWMNWIVTSSGQTDWTEIIASASLTMILLATATYAARQSKLHRDNEHKMNWFALEVNALDPFIASLSEDQQQELKAMLSKKLFGNSISSESQGKSAATATTVVNKDQINAVTNLVKELSKMSS